MEQTGEAIGIPSTLFGGTAVDAFNRVRSGEVIPELADFTEDQRDKLARQRERGVFTRLASETLNPIDVFAGATTAAPRLLPRIGREAVEQIPDVIQPAARSTDELFPTIFPGGRPATPPISSEEAARTAGRVTGPLEFPPEIAAQRAAKTTNIEAAAPDGPIIPPTDGTPPTPPAGSSGMPPLENRLLTLAGPGKLQNERLDQSLLRFHEAAIETSKREAGEIVTKGNLRLRKQNLGARSGTSLAARPEDIPRLDQLNEALHNPSRVASGEITVPEELRGMFDELRGLMDWETTARLDFDPEMATVADYFYRGWKPPKGMFPDTGANPGSLVSNPAFRKPRNNATYQEMRELGFEPLFWNPYEQWRTARLQGVRFREQMELVDALKSSLGDDMIRPHSGGSIPDGWRVPQVGPAFEGKPFATINQATGEPQAMFTKRWMVRDELANPLENIRANHQPSQPPTVQKF